MLFCFALNINAQIIICCESENVETLTVPQGETVSFDAKFDYIYSVSLIKSLNGEKITPIGTTDVTSVSTIDARLINGNYTDYTYNNSSQGTVNKELPAINLGASYDINTVAVTWYSNSIYTASNYKIQGSNDSSTWTDLAVNLNSTGQHGQTVEIGVTGSWQYIRVFCVQGNHATWILVSELEAFIDSGEIEEVYIASDDMYKIEKGANGSVEITNNASTTADFAVKTNKQ